MARLTRTQKYAGLREQLANDREVSVSTEDLNKFENGAVVDFEALKEAGLVKQVKDGVKVLGQGELKVALTVKANKFSKTAQEKIEAAGGKAEVI